MPLRLVSLTDVPEVELRWLVEAVLDWIEILALSRPVQQVHENLVEALLSVDHPSLKVRGQSSLWRERAYCLGSAVWEREVEGIVEMLVLP